MNRIGTFLACVLAFLLQASPSAAQFEGIVESRNLTVDETDSAQVYFMTIWVADRMMRVHNSAIGSTPPSTIIYRNDKGVFWILNDEDKTYLEVLLNPEQEKGAGTPGDAGDSKAAIRKTGKSKKLLGYACDQYIVRGPDQVTEIWGTKLLPGLVRSLNTLLGAAEEEPGVAWTDELTALGVFPLSATTKVEGHVVESQEVTHIESRKLEKELFELPAEYKRGHPRNDLNQGPPRLK